MQQRNNNNNNYWLQSKDDLIVAQELIDTINGDISDDTWQGSLWPGLAKGEPQLVVSECNPPTLFSSHGQIKFPCHTEKVDRPADLPNSCCLYMPHQHT